ncbi:MAG: hypothetical protein JWO33_736, partial [Caulobacteraceae bacterium]|nr:hypothetical protein [Caulobacteraceae bacterium]
AGMDLKVLAAGKARLQREPGTPGMGQDRYGLSRFKGPVIAAVNGVAVAGGMELAMCCDIRIAAEEARFADTHARVGVIPGGQMSALLPRLIGLARAKEMSLAGAYIDAATAERWGLVNRVTTAAELMPTCLAMARAMAAVDGTILQTYNQLIDDGFAMTYAEALAHEDAVSTAYNARLDAGGFEGRVGTVFERGRAGG